jgi:hypothetical protein
MVTVAPISAKKVKGSGGNWKMGSPAEIHVRIQKSIERSSQKGPVWGWQKPAQAQ